MAYNTNGRFPVSKGLLHFQCARRVSPNAGLIVLFYADHDCTVDSTATIVGFHSSLNCKTIVAQNVFLLIFKIKKPNQNILSGRSVNTWTALTIRYDSSYLTKPRSNTIITWEANVIKIRLAHSLTQKLSRFQKFSVFQNDTITFVAIFKKTLYLEKVKVFKKCLALNIVKIKRKTLRKTNPFKQKHFNHLEAFEGVKTSKRYWNFLISIQRTRLKPCDITLIKFKNIGCIGI